VAILEDGADLHSERLAAILALVDAYAGAFAAELGAAVAGVAAGADGTVRPKMRFDPIIAACSF